MKTLQNIKNRTKHIIKENKYLILIMLFIPIIMIGMRTLNIRINGISSPYINPNTANMHTGTNSDNKADNKNDKTVLDNSENNHSKTDDNITDNTPDEPEYAESEPAENNEPVQQPSSSSYSTKIPVEYSKDTFANSVFVGDSLTEGLSIYDYIDAENVIAYKGMTIQTAKNEIENIAQRNPNRVLLLLGTNDILSGEISSQFASRYIELVQDIKKSIPEAVIYVQSIFPVSAEVEANRPMLANSRIDEYNAALKEASINNGYKYIDVCTKFKNADGKMIDHYSPDGIHLNYEYYKIWLNYLSQNL